MPSQKPLNRRQFTQLGAATVAGAAGTGKVVAGDQVAGDQTDQYADDSQIQPVGGQTIDTTGEKVPLAPPGDQPPNLKLPDIPKRKFGWAVVGLGQLALGQIMPAFGLCKLSEPTALVSGHPDKAKTVAEAYGIAENAI